MHLQFSASDTNNPIPLQTYLYNTTTMSDGVTNPSNPATEGYAEDKGKGKAADRVHEDAAMDEDDDDEDEDDDEEDDDFEGEVSFLLFPPELSD